MEQKKYLICLTLFGIGGGNPYNVYASGNSNVSIAIQKNGADDIYDKTIPFNSVAESELFVLEDGWMKCLKDYYLYIFAHVPFRCNIANIWVAGYWVRISGSTNYRAMFGAERSPNLTNVIQSVKGCCGWGMNTGDKMRLTGYVSTTTASATADTGGSQCFLRGLAWI